LNIIQKAKRGVIGCVPNEGLLGITVNRGLNGTLKRGGKIRSSTIGQRKRVARRKAGQRRCEQDRGQTIKGKTSSDSPYKETKRQSWQTRSRSVRNKANTLVIIVRDCTPCMTLFNLQISFVMTMFVVTYVQSL